MKLVATDFDGTFCPIGERVPERNIQAVRKWRAAGHKFGLNTGRGLSLTELELAKYPGLELDFLICTNGAAIFDGERHLLLSLPFPPDIKEGIFALPAFAGKYPLLVQDERHIYRLNSWAGDELGLDIVPALSREEAIGLVGLLQFSIACGTQKEAEEVAADTLAKFPTLVANINRGYLDINMEGASKDQGIGRLLLATGWEVEPDGLFAVGDDLNDLAAIEAYHGYAVESANPRVKAAARATYPSVGALMEDNL